MKMVGLNDEIWHADWNSRNKDENTPATDVARPGADTSQLVLAAKVTAERVFFVPRSQVLSNEYPHVEIVLLIDAAFVHRYLGVRFLDVFDAPDDPRTLSESFQLTAVFAIDRREYVFYPRARPAVIARDHRQHC